jgi:hypothetical protein
VNNSVFLFKDYRKFLLHLLDEPTAERGQQARWAAAAGCQPAYMSHILKGRAEFSLEQAEALSNHLFNLNSIIQSGNSFPKDSSKKQARVFKAR